MAWVWVVGALLLANVALPASAQQQSASLSKGSILTVRGEGKIEAPPDFALFDVTVSTKGRTLEEAAAAHEARATRALSVLEGLRGQGVEIQRSTFRLDSPPPNRQQPSSQVKPPEPQFTAQTRFSLKAKPIEQLNAMVSKLAESGLLEVQSVSLKVEQERFVLNQARRGAMVDAREQAEAYADAGNLQLVEITEVTDGEARPDGAYADLPARRGVQIILPKTIAFDASVNVTWRIAPR